MAHLCHPFERAASTKYLYHILISITGATLHVATFFIGCSALSSSTPVRVQIIFLARTTNFLFVGFPHQPYQILISFAKFNHNTSRIIFSINFCAVPAFIREIDPQSPQSASSEISAFFTHEIVEVNAPTCRA